MTAQEFKEEFNLRYNNALEGAPGLDTFEISSYLTIAQEQYVKMHYDGTKDLSTGFEYTEKCRRVLSPLVRNVNVKDPVGNLPTPADPLENPLLGMTDDSVFYELADNVMYILLETVLHSGTIDSCGVVEGGTITPVIPTTHDEFHSSIKNPFRKPSKKKVFRMDTFIRGGKLVVEVIPPPGLVIQQYRARYLAQPFPIIVESLTSAEDVSGMGLTIEGKTQEATCKLADFTHREIINIAVQNAVLDYRESNLQGRVQLDGRV
jgi:hypothetical protein